MELIRKFSKRKLKSMQRKQMMENGKRRSRRRLVSRRKEKEKRISKQSCMLTETKMFQKDVSQ